MSLSQSSMIFTIGRLNQTVRFLLEQEIGRVYLSGEISNFIQPASGHWYFTLKDDFAQVRCVMFRNNNRSITFRPQHGHQLLVFANITLYEPRGDYQIIVESMQPAGEGVLQKKFEQLKMKLSIEGLFNQEFKQPLPSSVCCVGVITSKTGAALHDILHVLKRRDLSLFVIIYPTAVQGDNAPEQIVRAIELANARKECDVLIVARGGGSLEDLWSFNDERVARAIFASDIPVVTAIGHETDVTIADYVADLRAPTPSAAAEIVSCNQIEQLKQFEISQQRLEMAIDYFLINCSTRLTQLDYRLQQQHPQMRLSSQQIILERLFQNMKIALNSHLRCANKHQQFLSLRLNRYDPHFRIWKAQNTIQQLRYRLSENIRARLNAIRENFSSRATHFAAINPLLTLVRGYSITIDVKGNMVKQTKKIKVGDILTTRLVDGWVVSEVKFIMQKRQ